MNYSGSVQKLGDLKKIYNKMNLGQQSKEEDKENSS